MTSWMHGLSGWRYSNPVRESRLKRKNSSRHRFCTDRADLRIVQINALHGTLLEFGENIHTGRAAVGKELPAAMGWMTAKLPPYLIPVLEDQYSRRSELDMLIDSLEKQLNRVVRQSKTVNG